MKKKYSTLPESMKKMEMYGFNWMEFVISVPSPLYIMTSYKSNGQPNACMQSWTTFTGGKSGYFAIFPLSANMDIYIKQFMKQVKLSSISCLPICMISVCQPVKITILK